MLNSDEIRFDDGLPVTAVDFDFDALDDPIAPENAPDSVDESRAALERRQAAATVLAILTTGASPKQAGQRAFILAHALRLGTCRTQKDLAKKLHVTPGRVSQILNAATRALGL